MKFNQGDRIRNIETGESGVVKRIFPDLNPPMIIVEYDSGLIQKAKAEDVIIEPTPEVKNVSVEDVSAISYDDYIRAVYSVVMNAESVDNDLFMSIVADITDTIFSDGDSILECVVISEERFIEIIIDKTRPSIISEYLGNKPKIDNVISISFRVGLALMDVVPVLFKDSE